MRESQRTAHSVSLIRKEELEEETIRKCLVARENSEKLREKKALKREGGL